MKLELKRHTFTENSTIGTLYIDGVEECYTLEDRVRPDGEKVPGETAIPEGTYDVTIETSPRFARKTPRLHDVPNFEGVLIHWGNTQRDTRGCILVGKAIDDQPDRIDTSRREFFDSLMPKLQAAKDGITITISSPVAEKGVPKDARRAKAPQIDRKAPQNEELAADTTPAKA